MSNIVFVSCAKNVYVICNQALAIFTWVTNFSKLLPICSYPSLISNLFSKLRHPINYVYFWYSLIFLLARTSLVFMTASKIHDASLLPLRSLYLVPSDGWTQEVQRFADQLTSEFVGLSGYRLFCLTRKSLFGVGKLHESSRFPYWSQPSSPDASHPGDLRTYAAANRC